MLPSPWPACHTRSMHWLDRSRRPELHRDGFSSRNSLNIPCSQVQRLFAHLPCASMEAHSMRLKEWAKKVLTRANAQITRRLAAKCSASPIASVAWGLSEAELPPPRRRDAMRDRAIRLKAIGNGHSRLAEDRKCCHHGMLSIDQEMTAELRLQLYHLDRAGHQHQRDT